MPYFVSMKSSFNVLPISPSSPFDFNEVEAGLDMLASRGLKILEPATLRDFFPNYLNGSDEQRLRELQNGIERSDCDLLWVARGGYGLTRILSSLNLPTEKAPKIVGFSDATALLLHLWRHRGAKGI